MKRAAPAGMLLLSLLTAVSTAGADSHARSLELWGFQGIATQSLKDWNDRNDFFDSGLEFFGIPGQVHGFGRAIPYGGELSYRLWRRVWVGVATSQQEATASNRVNDTVGLITADTEELGIPGTYTERFDLSLKQVMVVVGFEIPGTSVFTWGNLGYGFAEGEGRFSFRGDADPRPSRDFDVQTTWDGNAMVGGLAVGLRRELGGRLLVRTSVGYQAASMGELDSPLGPPLNILGEPMETDFSGFWLSAGIGLVLTGAR